MSFLTVKQVADRLQVSQATVYQLCAQGKMPHNRFGVGRGTIRISPEQLQRYLEETEGAGRDSVPAPVPLRDIKYRGPSPS
jgi:excisionase family DNA binding protein